MTRSGYTDDFGDDYPGQMELYRANVRRSILSAKGQARLKELRDALEAMPEKRLVANVFLEPDNACALGIWARAHRGANAVLDAAVDGFNGDDHETADLLRQFGWPKLVVLDLIYQNDRHETAWEPDRCGPHEYPGDYRNPRSWPIRRWRDETDEERHARVLAWVRKQIMETGE
jgi:hypothetical protein